MSKPDLIPSRGAIAEPLVMDVKRQLTPADLLRIGDAPKTSVPVLQKLRATHHRQAQLLAQGKTIGEVAMIVGCTPQRLTQLQNDPTFVELMAYYTDQVMAAAMEDGARLRDKLIDVGEMAVDEIRERLADAEGVKKIRIGELRQIGEFAMDRTVAPPKAAPNAVVAPTTITMNFGTPIKRESEATMTLTGTVEPKDGED